MEVEDKHELPVPEPVEGEEDTDNNNGGEGEGIGVVHYNRREIMEEVKRQLWLSGPLVAVNLIHYSIQLSSVTIVGHVSQLVLSAASIATSFAGLTGYSLLMGMRNSLDSLCGQAYGVEQYRLSTYTRSAMVLLLLMSIPIGFMWTYMSQILMMIGQDPEISVHDGTYVQWMIPSLFAYSLFLCQMKFLKSQNNVLPVTVATGITAGLHVLLC